MISCGVLPGAVFSRPNCAVLRTPEIVTGFFSPQPMIFLQTLICVPLKVSAKTVYTLRVGVPKCLRGTLDLYPRNFDMSVISIFHFIDTS